MKSFIVFLLSLSLTCVACSQSPDSTAEASDLYEIGFSLLAQPSPERSDSISLAISLAPGVVSASVDPSDSTCTVKITHLDHLDSVLNIFKKMKVEFDPIVTAKSANLTCPDWQESPGAPATAVPMIELAASLDSFKLIFNRLSEKTRVVSLPNPACKACVKGQRIINEMFQNEWAADTSLAGLFVLLSLDGWGTLSDAQHLAAENTDPRAVYFWDASQRLGKAFKKPLGLRDAYRGAWDAYLVFAPGIRWTEEAPPAPSFWMHQMYPKESGAPKNLMLDKEVFLEKMAALKRG